jgi:uncharacterized caspase-like protein
MMQSSQPPFAVGWARRLLSCLPLMSAAALFVLSTGNADARRLALLVGVGDYQDQDIPSLQGPVNDVPDLAAVLSALWGFAAQDIRTLVDAEATRASILRGLDDLIKDSASGDLVLFYFSGHGTSPQDPVTLAHQVPLPHGTGALATWDSRWMDDPRAVMASLLVGRTDLKPRLQQLERGGRDVLVLLDACYSAHSTRGLFKRAIGGAGGELPVRRLPSPLQLGDYGTGRRTPPPPYPYRQVVTLAAANPWELAVDIDAINAPRYDTLDHRAHGAFTNALLRVLHGHRAADLNGDTQVSYAELAQAIDRQLRGQGFPQRPQLFPAPIEDQGQITRRGLFGSRTAASPGSAKMTDSAPDLVVRLTPAAQQFTGVLSQLQDVRLANNAPDLVITRHDNAWLLTNAGGDKIGTAGDQAKLVSRVRQLAWLHQLRQRQGDGPFELILGLADPGLGMIRHLGDPVQLQVRAEHQSWLVLLYIDADGVVAPLYPARSNEARPLPANSMVQIPEDDSMVVTEPLGTDLVVALAYPHKPAFLGRLIELLAPMQGPEPLPRDSALYRAILASVDDRNAVAIATLEIQTMHAPKRP